MNARDLLPLGIALALLAGLRPSGVVAASLLFGALTTGGRARTGR